MVHKLVSINRIFLHEKLRLSFEQRTLGSKCETPLEHFPAIFFMPETSSIEKVHFENKHEGNKSFEMPQEFPTCRNLVLWFHVSFAPYLFTVMVDFTKFPWNQLCFSSFDQGIVLVMNFLLSLTLQRKFLLDKEGQCWSSCQQNWGGKLIEFHMVYELDGGQFEIFSVKNCENE